MKKIVTVLSLSFLITAYSSSSYAQTTYKSDSGFFTPMVESLFLRGGTFEETQLIGPAVGYRFDKSYDLMLHTEFLSSESKFNNQTNPRTTLLNLGVTLGRTNDLSDNLLLRSEASLYQSIVFDTKNYGTVPNPSLTSGMVSSSLYWNASLSESVSILPNIGAFLGYGNYTAPYSSANLRQGFDGFVVGPKFGLDTSFQLSSSFYLIARPEYNYRYNTGKEQSINSLLFTIQLNF